MLKHKSIFYHVKRKSMSNVYISASEFSDLIDNLTTGELKLYSALHEAVLKNPTPEYFDNKNLATKLGLSVGSIKNAKTALNKKGYASIVKFKDETNQTCLRVIVGKDQMQLYNLGIKVEITDSKEYNKLVERYDLLNPKLTDKQRKEIVNQINNESNL